MTQIVPDGFRKLLGYLYKEVLVRVPYAWLSPSDKFEFDEASAERIRKEEEDKLAMMSGHPNPVRWVPKPVEWEVEYNREHPDFPLITKLEIATMTKKPEENIEINLAETLTSPDTDKALVCPICGKEFADKYQLASHIGICGERPMNTQNRIVVEWTVEKLGNVPKRATYLLVHRPQGGYSHKWLFNLERHMDCMWLFDDDIYWHMFCILSDEYEALALFRAILNTNPNKCAQERWNKVFNAKVLPYLVVPDLMTDEMRSKVIVKGDITSRNLDDCDFSKPVPDELVQWGEFV